MRTRLLLMLAVALAACGDDTTPIDSGPDTTTDAGDASDADAADTTPDAGPIDYASTTLPDSTTPEAGIRRELVLVAGATPPANPTTGAETPTELNFTRVARYRIDEDPAREARAVVVAMPGFLAGIGSLEGLARGVVRESEGDIEVWVVDRRANLLENLVGMNTAEAADDPELAQEYYFGDATIDGEPFEGFRQQSELSYASEWGLATLVEDVHQVIAQVPELARRERVFLLGHSLGGRFAEAYAGWRFEDGSQGADELAGIILVDGVLGDEPSTEDTFLNGSTIAGFPGPGITLVREEQPVVVLPLIGLDIYARAEIMSMRTLLDPTAVVVDRGRDAIFGTLYGYRRSEQPNYTNAAALAFAFDDASGPLFFARAKLGEFDGETEFVESTLFGTDIERPVPNADIGWTDASESGEVTDIAEFATAFSHGNTNFAEWYFPYRLTLDLDAVGGAAIAEDSWQAETGLRAFDGATMDAPILAVACGLIGTPDAYTPVRSRVADTIGEGRPSAGMTRDDEGTFVVLDATEIAHLDPGLAGNAARNPTIGATIEFVEMHTPDTTLGLELTP